MAQDEAYRSAWTDGVWPGTLPTDPEFRKKHPNIGWILNNSTGDVNYKANIPRLTDEELEYCLQRETRKTGLSQLRGEVMRRRARRGRAALKAAKAKEVDLAKRTIVTPVPASVLIDRFDKAEAEEEAAEEEIDLAPGHQLKLFVTCLKCGHIEEDHATDAPEGEQKCMAEGCDCPNFEPEEEH